MTSTPANTCAGVSPAPSSGDAAGTSFKEGKGGSVAKFWFPKTTKRKPSAVAKREMAKIRKVLGLPRLPEPI